MIWKSWSARALGVLAVLGVMSVMLGGSGGPVSAAVTCPTVDPVTGAVSPAPAPGVAWYGCDLTNADLHAAYMPGAGLGGANLTGANLSGADLANAYLHSTYMPGVDLAGATVTAADLYGADLAGSNLAGANLTGSTLTGASVENSDLTGADLASTILDGVFLNGSTLTNVRSGGITGNPIILPANWILATSPAGGYLAGPGADFSGQDLSTVSFHPGPGRSIADLAGADFAGATVRGLVDANLTGANLTGAILRNAGFNGSDLTNADLSNADLTDADLSMAILAGAKLANATLTGIQTWGLTGTPASLPANWLYAKGYLLGPGAALPRASLGNADLSGADLAGADLTGAFISGSNLTGADLTGANLTMADLSQATFSGATIDNVLWSSTTCPDGTNSDSDGGTCANNIVPGPVATPVVSGTAGQDGWYVGPVTVTWNWSSLNSAIDPAHCTTSTTSTSQGDPVTLTATCQDLNGVVGPASMQVQIDTTPPLVSVTGVSAGAVYALGQLPTPGCSTTDSLSGVVTSASVAVTSTGTGGTGLVTATCSGAADYAGNQTAPVSVHYTVGYGFSGFIAPKPGATLSHTLRTVAVKFRLATAAGTPIPASVAAALAKAGDVKATLAGPGITTVTAACSWNAKGGYFQCPVKKPAGVKVGTSYAYAITAKENVGSGLVTAPAIGTALNPETIHFK